MSEKYNELKKIYQSSNEFNSTLESKYQVNVEHQISKYKEFLQIAKQHHKTLDPKEEIVGLYSSNDRIPFNFERGDTIGVSLATSVFTEQVEQSEQYLKQLEQQNSGLEQEIKDKMQISEKLQVYIEEVNKRIDQDEGPRDVLDELDRQVQEEKLRYRRLRKILKQLIQEYVEVD